jgi:hypothetical protein
MESAPLDLLIDDVRVITPTGCATSLPPGKKYRYFREIHLKLLKSEALLLLL